MKKMKKTKIKDLTNFPMNQRLEIWTITQKRMTMNENVKKEEKRKGREKHEENEKEKTKN